MTDKILNYDTFLNRIKSESGNLSSVYVFYGNEKHLFKEAVDILKRKFLSDLELQWNCEEVDANILDADALQSSLYSAPFIGKRRLIIVKNSENYFAASNKNKKLFENEREFILQYLNNVKDGSCLVIFLVSGKIDRRAKITKKINDKGTIIEFSPIKEQSLIKRINNKLKIEKKQMDAEALKYLVACLGDNYETVEQELNKVILYAGDKSRISVDMVKDVISRSVQVGIFEVVDAVGERKSAKAIHLMREMLDSGESPPFIITMIVRQIRLMLLTKCLANEGFTQKQIASRLRLHPYVHKKVMNQAANFSEKDLKDGLLIMLEADKTIKTSNKDSKVVLETGILSLYRKTAP